MPSRTTSDAITTSQRCSSASHTFTRRACMRTTPMPRTDRVLPMSVQGVFGTTRVRTTPASAHTVSASKERSSSRPCPPVDRRAMVSLTMGGVGAWALLLARRAGRHASRQVCGADPDREPDGRTPWRHGAVLGRPLDRRRLRPQLPQRHPDIAAQARGGRHLVGCRDHVVARPDHHGPRDARRRQPQPTPRDCHGASDSVRLHQIVQKIR